MKYAGKSMGPGSCWQPPIFIIGRYTNGNWVAREQSGARGGLFVDRAQALKYARFESGNRAHALVWVSGFLELAISSAPSTVSVESPTRHGSRERRIA